ncbi:MAG: glycosyl hydrolase-related protein [Bacteroidales bacterium]|jgi:alpha-mannosidase
MKRCATLAIVLILALSYGFSQPNLKEVIKKQSKIAGDLSYPMEGFAQKIAGEDILYHGTRQDCQNALLVRATDGTMSISWETPAVSSTTDAKEIQLFLIAGMSMKGYETKGVDPGFHVFINDKPFFYFKNSMGEDWTVSGPEGSQLKFNTVIKDQANDGFGYAQIILPLSVAIKGQPVTVKVSGDAAGSRHWFMVFQCTDGLDWFRKKTGIDGWMEVQLSQREGKWHGLLIAPESQKGQMIDIFGNIGKPQKVKLGSQNGQATAQFILPLQATELTVDWAWGLTVKDIEFRKPGSKSVILPDRLVSYQVSSPNPMSYIIQVQSATSSISNDLNSIANSEIGRGKIMIMASSHQDIAWMDSPQACVENRDNLLITPALKMLKENPLYFNDMEDILMLREYLARHPEKKELIHSLAKEGRLTWGASYIQPYEEMYFGEPLIRQFYLGRKWFKNEFPGCDARIYWNVDVPGRTLQMPQILAKSGVDYMIISRQDKGLFNWLAPDGSKVLTYSSDHYYNSYVNLKKGFFESVRHFADLTDFWDKYYTPAIKNPVMPVLSDADMAVPDSYFDYIDTWNSLRDSSLKLPELVHSTAERFMDAAVETGIDFPALQGERPAVWLYIHGPSHFEALKAGRSAGTLLPAAEKMASLRSLVSNNWDIYPQERLTKAWESAIYPDHGWGGKNGDITDQTFLDKFREADVIAKSIMDESTRDIAGNIGFRHKGIPLVIFNSLSWERSDPVRIRLNIPDRSFKAMKMIDDQGAPVVFQITGPEEYYVSGYLKSLEVAFIAENIPSLGYKTYYVAPGKKMANSAQHAFGIGTVETDFFIIKFGKGGIESIFDKDLRKEALNTDQFKAGEIFSMNSVGNGAGEFADIQQPDMKDFEKPEIGPNWNIRESGPVRIVIDGMAKMNHNTAKVTFTIYQKLKRIDFKVDLLDWDGTAYREFRMAFPARLSNPEISYEVPFGVVRVGKDELARPAGERYTTLCKDVHPRGINNWISANDSDLGITISSSVAVWDYVNPTSLPTNATLLQPILLASRQSCHGEGPLYHQKGSHSMEFSLTTHQPGWENGYRMALQANEKLMVVVNPKSETSVLPARFSFLSVDDPNSIVSTLKKSDNADELIIRVYDQEGRDKMVQLNLFISPQAIEHTNLIEEEGKQVSRNATGMTFKLGHHAIETYKIRF